MPERIPTAEIRSLDPDSLHTDDAFPGAYGFYVALDRDPGPEWGTEFDAVYDVAVYAGKPPVVFEGERLGVFYLPRYANDLPRFLRFLQGIVADTNRGVEKRNSVLPDEEAEKAAFRQTLQDLARRFP